MSKFLSRKFLMAVGLVVFAILGVLTGQLTWDQASGVIQAAVISFLAAEGLGDVVGRLPNSPSDTAWTATPSTQGDAASKSGTSGVAGI